MFSECVNIFLISTGLSCSLLTTHSGADPQQPNVCNVMGNAGNPDHVTSDVVVDMEACLRMVPILVHLGLLKVNQVKKSLCFETKISTPIWQCGTSLWMKWFILL